MKRLTLVQAKSFFEYRSLDEVARYQEFKPREVADAVKFIESTATKLNVLGSWYQLGIFLKENRVHMGDIGIHFFSKTEVEMGCTVSPFHWGKGYATEGLSVVISYIFEVLTKENITAQIDPSNTRSRRFFERLGFLSFGRSSKYLIYELSFGQYKKQYSECTI